MKQYQPQDDNQLRRRSTLLTSTIIFNDTPQRGFISFLKGTSRFHHVEVCFAHVFGLEQNLNYHSLLVHE